MRVLFTTQPGHGHLQPMAPYAQALAAAGHEVRVATSASFAPAVAALGLETIPVGLDFTWEQPTDRFPHLIEARAAGRIGDALLDIVWDQWVPPTLSDLRGAIDGWRPDVIVREALEFAAIFAGEAEDIPVLAAAWGTLQIDPAWELDGVKQERFVAAYDRLADIVGCRVDARSYWGSEPSLSSLPASWIPPDLDPRPPVHNFRLPPLDGADDQVPPEWLRSLERPLVYATLGTVYWWDHALRACLLEACEQVDAEVLLTVGRRVDPARIVAPGNVRIERYVPQSLVLPRCSAVVSHAGLGTMIGAIAQGVPMVLIDLGTDHTMNATRARELGIASTFPRAGINAQALGSAITSTLGEPTARRRAEEVAADYAQLPPAADAARVVLSYARTS